MSEYLETKLQIFQIDIEARITDLISNMILVMLLLGTLTISAFFVLLFLATSINFWTGHPVAGYGFVASLCLFLLFILSRKKVQDYITSKVKEKIILTIKKKQDGNQDTRGL